jgi:hypothetical protein
MAGSGKPALETICSFSRQRGNTKSGYGGKATDSKSISAAALFCAAHDPERDSRAGDRGNDARLLPIKLFDVRQQHDVIEGLSILRHVQDHEIRCCGEQITLPSNTESLDRIGPMSIRTERTGDVCSAQSAKHNPGKARGALPGSK